MAANLVIQYSVPGDSVRVRSAGCGHDPATWTEEQVADELWAWRTPDGTTVMVELLGWPSGHPNSGTRLSRSIYRSTTPC